MDKFEYVNEVAEKINLEFINKVKNLTKKDKYVSLLLDIDNEPFFLRGLNKNTAPTIVNIITYAGNLIFCNSIKDGLRIDSSIVNDVKSKVSSLVCRDDINSLAEAKKILLDRKYENKEFSKSKKYAIYFKEINGLRCHFVDIKINKSIYKKLKSNKYIVDMFSSKIFTNDFRGVPNIIHCKNIFDINCIVLNYKGKNK